MSLAAVRRPTLAGQSPCWIQLRYLWSPYEIVIDGAVRLADNNDCTAIRSDDGVERGTSDGSSGCKPRRRRRRRIHMSNTRHALHTHSTSQTPP